MIIPLIYSFCAVDTRRAYSYVPLRLLQGSLVGVVGKVGAGKSSLLHAILAEMNKEHGSIEIANLDDVSARFSKLH